jgi:hypothetical protein
MADPFTRSKKNLERAEAEANLIETIVSMGPSAAPNRFTHALCMLGLFLVGAFFTVTHTVHQNSLIVRSWGPIAMLASLMGTWVAFQKRSRKPPSLLSDDERPCPDFLTRQTPAQFGHPLSKAAESPESNSL